MAAPLRIPEFVCVEHAVHPVGLYVQSQGEVVGGHRIGILRNGLLGVRIEFAANIGGDLRQLPGRKARTAPEHHVLLGMRHSGKATRRLVGAGLIVDDDGDDRSQPVSHDHYAQAITECLAKDVSRLARINCRRAKISAVPPGVRRDCGSSMNLEIARPASSIRHDYTAVRLDSVKRSLCFPL